MSIWLLMLGMGVLTYAIRLSMILLSSRVELAPDIQQALRYVPPAVLSAIIAPELFRPAGVLDVSLGNERLLAGILAILVAWVTRNVIVTIAAGMVALWILQALS